MRIMHHLIPKYIRNRRLQQWLEQIQLYLAMGYSFSESLTHIDDPSLPIHIHQDILYQMNLGKPFHACFKNHPLYFDDIWIDILSESHNFPSLLQTWNVQLNEENKLHAQLQQQLFYPSLLCGIGIIFLLFFQWVIYPQYQTLYAQFNIPDVSPPSSYTFEFSLLSTLLFFFKNHLPFFHKLPKLWKWYRCISYMNIQNQHGKTFYQSIQSAQLLFRDALIHPKLQLIEEQLRFGQGLNIKLPKYLPNILQQTFIIHPTPNNLQRSQQILEMEIKCHCKKREQIIQPLMLLCLAGLCCGLIITIYQPLIKMGQYF
jgi:type II secretory pathway component PulF